MSIWNAASTATTTVFNGVTTTAITVDKGIMSAYHAAHVLETNAANWSAKAQRTAELDRDYIDVHATREHDRRMANKTLEFKRELDRDPELAAIYAEQVRTREAREQAAKQVTSAT